MTYRNFKKEILQLTPILCFLGVGLQLCGCSADQNIFRQISTEAEQSSVDNLMELAEQSYDQGDYDTAQAYIDTALAKEPRAFSGLILSGYISMAKEGLEPIEIARSLTDPAGGNDSSSASSSSSSDQLINLSLTNDEIIALGEYDMSDPEYPVLIPECADEIREVSPKLRNINLALTKICGLIDSDVKNEDDYRDASCLALVEETPKAHRAKTYFLWALIHMVEASIFQSVVTYGGSGSTSNLNKRLEKLSGLDTSDPSNLDAIISQVEQMENIMDKMFPINSSCVQTQFSAILIDLYAASNAFAKMPGLPQEIVSKISQVIDKIKEYESSMNEATGGADLPGSGELRALKNKFTEGAAKQISTMITQLEESGQDISAEQKTQLCSSFNSLGGSNGNVPAPTLCQ